MEAGGPTLLLHVSVKEARGLLALDQVLKSPYLELTVDNSTYQTEIIQENNVDSPGWNEQFLFLVPNSAASVLRIDLYDSSLSEKHRFVGYIKANLSAVNDNKAHDHWFKFRPSDKKTPDALTGEILITLQFYTSTLIKQGALNKKSSGMLGTFNKRKFYLLDGMLLYSKANKPSGLIYLDGVTTEKVDVKKRPGFKLITPNGGEKVLCAETEEERDEWVAAIGMSSQITSPLKKAHVSKRDSPANRKLKERSAPATPGSPDPTIAKRLDFTRGASESELLTHMKKKSDPIPMKNKRSISSLSFGSLLKREKSKDSIKSDSDSASEEGGIKKRRTSKKKFDLNVDISFPTEFVYSSEHPKREGSFRLPRSGQSSPAIHTDYNIGGTQGASSFGLTRSGSSPSVRPPALQLSTSPTLAPISSQHKPLVSPRELTVLTRTGSNASFSGEVIITPPITPNGATLQRSGSFQFASGGISLQMLKEIKKKQGQVDEDKEMEDAPKEKEKENDDKEGKPVEPEEPPKIPPPPPPPPSQLVQRLDSSKTVETLSFFQNAGEESGLQVWKIVKMVPIEVTSEDEIGRFYNGDSYICLYTHLEPGQNVWRIHFWIGEHAGMDSMATAAIRSKQLSDMLSGDAHHYRECQCEESEQFLGYFGGRIEYLDGGSESGFKHVEPPNPIPELIRVTGKDKRICTKKVPLTNKSLTKDDVFIVDTVQEVYMWIGREATRLKTAKGLDLASKMKAEHGCAIPVQVLDDGDDTEGFWKPLGGMIEVTASSDENEEHEVWLYKISNTDGKLAVAPIEDVAITKSLLDTNSCFILDCETDLYIWQGKKAPLFEKRASTVLAKEIMNMFERPDWTMTKTIAEGSEPGLFKVKFEKWVDPIVKKEKPAAAPKVKPVEVFDVKTLLKRQKVVDIPLNVVPGKGNLVIFSSIGNNWDTVPEDDFGQFLSTRAYVCHYIYMEKTKNSYKSIIYYWEGKESNKKAYISYSFSIRKQLERKMMDLQCDSPSELRLAQGKENKDFMRLFGGQIFIHKGFDRLAKEPVMFHVHGDLTNAHSVQLDQVDCASLNSRDCFIISAPKKAYYVWSGKGSTVDLRELALDMASLLQENEKLAIHEVEEGAETDDFWTLFPKGKSEYGNPAYLQNPEPQEGDENPHPPRLFKCSEVTGKFTVDEILNFDQDDLTEHDVMILDGYYEIFVWEGIDSTESEREKAWNLAEEYQSRMEDGRQAHNPKITKCASGEEPPSFRTFFLSWKVRIPKKYVDPMEAKKLPPKAAAKERVQQSRKADVLVDAIFSRRNQYSTEFGSDEEESDEEMSDEDFDDDEPVRPRMPIVYTTATTVTTPFVRPTTPEEAVSDEDERMEEPEEPAEADEDKEEQDEEKLDEEEPREEEEQEPVEEEEKPEEDLIMEEEEDEEVIAQERNRRHVHYSTYAAYSEEPAADEPASDDYVSPSPQPQVHKPAQTYKKYESEEEADDSAWDDDEDTTTNYSSYSKPTGVVISASGEDSSYAEPTEAAEPPESEPTEGTEFEEETAKPAEPAEHVQSPEVEEQEPEAEKPVKEVQESEETMEEVKEGVKETEAKLEPEEVKEEEKQKEEKPEEPKQTEVQLDVSEPIAIPSKSAKKKKKKKGKSGSVDSTASTPASSPPVSSPVLATSPFASSPLQAVSPVLSSSQPVAIPPNPNASSKKKKKKKKKGGLDASTEGSPFSSTASSPVHSPLPSSPLTLHAPPSPSVSRNASSPLVSSRKGADLEWAKDINWSDLEDEKGLKRGGRSPYMARRKQLDSIISQSQLDLKSVSGEEKEKTSEPEKQKEQEDDGTVPVIEKKKRRRKKKKKGGAKEAENTDTETDTRTDDETQPEAKEPTEEPQPEEPEVLEEKKPTPKIIKRYKMNENPNWAFVIDDSTDTDENVRTLVAPAPAQPVPQHLSPVSSLRGHRRRGSVNDVAYLSDGASAQRRMGHSRSHSLDYNSDGGVSRKQKQKGSGLKISQSKDELLAHTSETSTTTTQEHTKPAGSPKVSRVESPKVARASSPLVPRAESPKFDSPKAEHTESPKVSRAHTPVDSPKAARANSPQVPRATSPIAERSESPKPAGSPKVSRVESPVVSRAESPKVKRVESPTPERIESPKVERANSPQVPRAISPIPERAESPKVTRVDSPKVERASSSPKGSPKSSPKLSRPSKKKPAGGKKGKLGSSGGDGAGFSIDDSVEDDDMKHFVVNSKRLGKMRTKLTDSADADTESHT